MAKYYDIPSTRRQQFGYLLKSRWTDLVFSSIYLFIFIVPSLMWLLFGSSLVGQEENLYNVSIVYLILIPLIMIFGLGVGGVTYSLKRMCFSEGANIHKDLFYGIKKTCRDYLKIYFFVGVLYCLLHVGLSTLVNSSLDANTISVLEGVMYLAFLFMYIIINYSSSQATLYNCSTKQLFTNSLKFTFGKIIPNVGLTIIYLLPFMIFELIQLSGNPEVISLTEWICIGISGIFYFGFNKLMFLEYSLTVFDETINKNKYQEIIKKGLKIEEKDENEPIDITTF